MSQGEESGNAEGSGTSSAGRKRRSRFSTASSAIMSPSHAEASEGNAASSSTAPPSGSTTTGDVPMQDREKRGSRMFNQIRDGFRRSASSRSVAGIMAGSRMPLDGTLTGQATTDMAVDQSEGLEAQQGGRAVASDGVRQDKKRRRIGEYAGSDEAMVDGVGASSLDASKSQPTTVYSSSANPAEIGSDSAEQAASIRSSLPKTTSPPLLSPGLVPLTDSDPLLDDRLRTVEAIRSVLGDEVARRLPSVESLRELNHREGVIDDDDGTTTASLTADTRRARRSSRISLPPSTVELLDRLDRSSHHTEATEAQVTSLPPTEAPDQGTASTTTEQPAGSSTLQQERRARRTSIRNFTNRLGGWLGVGPSRTEETRADRLPIDTTQSETAQPEDQEAADRATLDGMTAAAAAEETPAPTHRLATGAVMIVQGFVQTTIPVRERRTRTAAAEGGSEQGEAQAGPSRLGPRRTFPHDGPSDALSARNITSSQMEMQEPVRSSADRLAVAEDDGQPGSIGVLDTVVGHAESLGGEGIEEAEQGKTAATAAGSMPTGTTERPTPLEASSSTSRSQNSIRSSLRSATRAQQQETLHQSDPAPVATAATATSLLSHGNPATPPSDARTGSQIPPNRASGPRAALEALRNRLRASGHSSGSTNTGGTDEAGSAGANRGVEDVLREYMRHAMASSRNASRLSDGDGSDRPPALSTLLPTSDPASFEAFLNDMQTSLIEALSAYVEESDAELDRESHGEVHEEAASSGSSTVTNAGVEAVPTTEPSVPAEEPAQPRRLNFFRLFQFPPRPSAPENPSDPAVDLIPIVIVGVRSMNGDINSLTAQNVAAAPFPFNPTDDIQGAAPAQEGATEAPAEPSGTGSQHRPAAPQRSRSAEARPPGSWGSRAMRSINRLRRPRNAITNAEATDTDETFTRNYVLWVVGGNYPAGHPILTIPHLFTGELTHEDLWILAEALGQAKPPVATRTDIENSGLAIIKGHQVRGQGDAGAILASSVDQCLICLADFEDEVEIDVRVMKCKHAYHKDCIDHWLEVGRNSCPACRQAGVERASDRPAETAATETAAAAQDEDVNMTS